ARTRLSIRYDDLELAIAETDLLQLRRHRGRERAGGRRPGRAQPRVERLHRRSRLLERRLGRSHRVVSLVECGELPTRLLRPLEQLGRRLGPVAAAEIRELLELALDDLQAARLRLEGCQERAQVRGRLAELQLALPKRVSGRRKLGREALERRDGAFRGRDEIARTAAVLR